MFVYVQTNEWMNEARKLRYSFFSSLLGWSQFSAALLPASLLPSFLLIVAASRSQSNLGRAQSLQNRTLEMWRWRRRGRRNRRSERKMEASPFSKLNLTNQAKKVTKGGGSRGSEPKCRTAFTKCSPINVQITAYSYEFTLLMADFIIMPQWIHS